MFDIKKLGQVIRYYRKERNLTLGKLGERAGLSASFICNMEFGDRRISLDSLDRLARGLRVKMSTLIRAAEVDDIATCKETNEPS